MGIAWLLLRRTFASRPKRTILFLLGYALSTAVMITLLAVGEAVLIQAQDKDLLGGGDIILVPQGIDVESIKVGGIGALFYSIPNARFIVRQLLGSSRFQNEIVAVSPYLYSQLLYARKGTAIETIFAEGSIPESEQRVKQIRLPWGNTDDDRHWLHPDPARLYHEIDRFHLPTAKSADLNRWAEWHYFNFHADGFSGYLSIMASGDVQAGNGKWIVSLQLHDGEYRRYSTEIPATVSELPLDRVDYRAGDSRIRFTDDHYELTLSFRDGTSVAGDLRFYPAPGLYFPPTELARSEDFESGYVIPAIRGTYSGELKVGSRTYSFNDVEGYHDHNWGIWRETEWNWGHAFSERYAVFFGEIIPDGRSKGVFAGFFDRSGFLTVFRPQQITLSNYRDHAEGIRVPASLEMNQEKTFASFKAKGDTDAIVATPVDTNKSVYFIQSSMNYGFELTIDGKTDRFSATGNAETFVRK